MTNEFVCLLLLVIYNHIVLFQCKNITNSNYYILSTGIFNLAARGRNSEVTVICYLAALTRGRGTVLGRMECVYVCKAQMTLRLHNSASTALADTKLH